MMFRFSSLRTSAAMLAAVLAVSACGDDSTDVPDNLEIVRLTVGTTTVHFDREGGLRACCDGAGNPTLNTRITIASTGNVAARTQATVATFHRSDGRNISLDPATHELRISVTGPAVTFTRTGPFTGNTFRASAGVANAELTIFNTQTNQAVFGPHPFRICTVAAAAPNTTDCAS
jgi:hypothetical protein